MREIRQSGSEGGVAGNGHPYPYLGAGLERRQSRRIGLGGSSGCIAGHHRKLHLTQAFPR